MEEVPNAGHDLQWNGMDADQSNQSAQARVPPVADIEPTARELEVANIEIKLAPDVTPRISRDTAIEVGLRNHFDKGGKPRTHTGVGATFGLVTAKGVGVVDVLAWVVTIDGVWVPPVSGLVGKEFEPTGRAILVLSDETGEEIAGVTLNYPVES